LRKCNSKNLKLSQGKMQKSESLQTDYEWCNCYILYCIPDALHSTVVGRVQKINNELHVSVFLDKLIAVIS
jgi:hypothetical protein